MRAEAGASSKVRRLSRSMTGGLSFNVMCFIGREAVTGSKDMRKVVLGEGFDQKMKDLIRERGFDDWAVTVQGRLATKCC